MEKIPKESGMRMARFTELTLSQLLEQTTARIPLSGVSSREYKAGRVLPCRWILSLG